MQGGAERTPGRRSVGGHLDRASLLSATRDMELHGRSVDDPERPCGNQVNGAIGRRQHHPQPQRLGARVVAAERADRHGSFCCNPQFLSFASHMEFCCPPKRRIRVRRHGDLVSGYKEFAVSLDTGWWAVVTRIRTSPTCGADWMNSASARRTTSAQVVTGRPRLWHDLCTGRPFSDSVRPPEIQGTMWSYSSSPLVSAWPQIPHLPP